MTSKSWYNDWEEENEDRREDLGKIYADAYRQRSLEQENNKTLFQENENGQLEFVLPKNNTSEDEVE